MNKKVVCVITEMPHDEFWLPLSIMSYKDWADAIIIVDGTRTSYDTNALTLLSKIGLMNDKIKIIPSVYPHADKGADGKQRNVYLNYIKEHYDGDIAVVVDSDEVLADDAEQQINDMIKIMIEHNIDVCNPRMEHFIGDFNHVDATVMMHWCPCRMFRISNDLEYPDVEHVLLYSKTRPNLRVLQDDSINSPVFFYHYGYTKGKETIIKKYFNNLEKSNIHSKQFLESWKNSHIMGRFPTKTFMGKHPEPVQELFFGDSNV